MNMAFNLVNNKGWGVVFGVSFFVVILLFFLLFNNLIEPEGGYFFMA